MNSRTQKRKCANAQTPEKADAARERKIARLRMQLEKASAAERAAIWRQMRDEIMVRSPEQIERMEVSRGLAA
jgi:hypothetical protein